MLRIRQAARVVGPLDRKSLVLLADDEIRPFTLDDRSVEIGLPYANRPCEMLRRKTVYVRQERIPEHHRRLQAGVIDLGDDQVAQRLDLDRTDTR